MLGVAVEAEVGEEVLGQAVEGGLPAAAGQLVEPAQLGADVELGPGLSGDEQSRLVEGDLVVGKRHEIGEAGLPLLAAVCPPVSHYDAWAWAMASSKLVLALRSLR